MNKKDFLFIFFPFLLTAIFIVVGYNILVSQTPEASIFIRPEESNIEILTNGDIERIAPQVDVPSRLTGRIQAIPQNKAELTDLIKIGLEEQTNIIYLSLPVTINSDYSFTLNGVENSSEENIIRWIKTTISQAHKRNFHVVFAVTLNAKTVISDADAFTANYIDFVTKWANLANEYSVSFFSPGITLGHPLYSQITEQEVSKILLDAQEAIRKTYAGPLGVGLCCTEATAVDARGYSYVTIIPTPEYPFISLMPAADTLTELHQFQTNFFYDRNGSKVTSYEPYDLSKDIPLEREPINPE